MANQLELPGFYWNVARGKYFKIPPSGSVPAAHAHSAETIRQHQERDRDARDAQSAWSRNKGRIFRASTKFTALQYDMFYRERGCGRALQAVQSYYLSMFGYTPVHFRNGRASYRATMTDEGFPSLHVAANSGHGVFDVSMKHSTLLWVSDMSQEVSSVNLASELDTRDKVSVNDRPLARRPTNVCDGNNYLNSIDIHQESGLVLTTWQDAFSGHNIYLTTLEGKCLFQLGRQYQTRLEEGARTPEPRYIINAAAVDKSGGKYSFLIGGNLDKIVGVDRGHGGGVLSTLSPGCFENRHNEVFAIEMLEDDPNLYVVGQRSGLFRVFDDRTDTRVETIRAQHVSSICKIKDMGDKKFVVSGLQDTMSIYDIRYMKENTHSLSKVPNLPPLAAKGLAQTEEPWTLPVGWMHCHKNKHERKADLAVDRATGMIAAAQHNGAENSIMLFDMYTGHSIMDCATTQTEANYHLVKQIRWVNDGQQKGENVLKSLWFTKGPRMYAARWAEALPAHYNDMMDEMAPAAA